MDINKQLDFIAVKLDKFDDRLDRIEKSQGLMNKDLKYHIKRTNLLEDEFKPIRTKYQQAKGVFLFMGGVSAVAGVIEVVLRILGRP